MKKYEGCSNLEGFVNEEKSHGSTMQFWINSDEDTIALDYDKGGSFCARIITDKIYDFDGDKKDAHAWGFPFEALASFVDAVRAMQTTEKK